MSKRSKRVRSSRELVDSEELYTLSDALGMVKEHASVKFDESVDVAVNLGVNARKSDQNVRGATLLPNGTGKDVRVAVFATGDNAKAAEEAGADIVGFEDLAQAIKDGQIDFDLCIATPDTMPVVGQLGQILGPRGLMPNPKVGTVSADPATAVKNAKSGQVSFRIDRGGVIHCPVGKASFSAESLQENVNALISALIRAKPASAKGQYIKRVSVSSTMGPGIRVDRQSVSVIH
ncbi:MAG: 50S ribosomal protein L1 [Gammaproteobacteria bacterium]|nr:50S ribosomal protein L1 [Gammaproteobacteria bacterium]